jgi:anti-sigma B factor antagonist
MNQQTRLIQSIDRDGDTATLRLAGDVDLSSSPELRQALRQVMGRRPRATVVDLTRVAYMDSSGLATLVEALKRAGEYGGRLRLVGLNPRVRAVFEISQLDRVFEIVPGGQEAT